MCTSVEWKKFVDLLPATISIFVQFCNVGVRAGALPIYRFSGFIQALSLSPYRFCNVGVRAGALPIYRFSGFTQALSFSPYRCEMMTLDGNERRRITPDTPTSPTHGSVVLRNARPFNLRDNSPANRHSYHGITSPLMSPRERPDQMKRFSQQLLQYPLPYGDPFCGNNHIQLSRKQVCLWR
ncbi:unnamed protein product [Strongylus vulgaris]|uniref:Uncharacterized protein n=1 Tax=Strongylus vulgaris TaxID=40348 RepID=A0A3P7JQX9_STRVU|nr:unnamed protein product [Strongylus vulgaris]